MAQLAIAPARTDRLTGRCTHLSATMAGYGQIVLGFRRTCKVPDNDEKFYAPDLGPYLLYDVKKYRGLPRSILDAGGWFIAMRDDEAMYVDFGSSRKFNVTVGSHTSRKAHCIVGWRHYLDGLPDSDSPGCVRQFVAAPASRRSQINSSDELLVDDLSLAIRTPKDVLNQAGIIVTTRDMEEVNIPINDVTTVDQLKSRIEHEMGVPKNVQRIVFRGKQLEDDTTLSSNGIAEGTAVHLVERMTGGGSGCLPAFFASHKMILKPGDRIWQPEACKEEETQSSWAETPTVIRVHILNAENVRDWTGIDPPQSTVDPERYKSAGLSSAGDTQEYERRALENPDLYDQIEEYYYGKSPIMPLREHNPFRVILRKNAEDQSNETRGQGSKSKIRWWHRIFQKSK